MKTKLAKSKVGVILDHIFFGGILTRLYMVEDNNQPTGYTDGKVIGFNRKFIENSDINTVKFFLIHETMHVALMHHLRRDGRDHILWNIACDYVINLLLKDAGLSVPEFALLDEKYKDMGSEAVYNQLKAEGFNGDAPGSNNGSDIGEVRDYPGNTTEQHQAAQDIKVAVSQAYNQAKAAGKVPAGLDKVIEGMLTPKVDWREVLRDFVSTAAKDDYSWRRPSRRYSGGNIVSPGLYSEKLGEVVVAVDSSGSMGDDDLQKAASEISGILEDFPGASVRVLYCDTEIHHKATQVFEQEDFPVKLKAKGGGGTRFSPVFEHIETFEEQPMCLLYMSDLWCSDYPSTEPGYPVIWGATEETPGSYDPPFGTVVDLY